MQIKIVELKQIVGKLFSHLEEIGLESIKIDEDYYWHISEEERFDMSHHPTDLGVGQLSDDWEFLSKLLEDDRDAVSYDFVYLARILEIIGEKIIH